MIDLKVKDHPGLVRNSFSKAIINIDKDAYSEYKAKKQMHQRVASLESDVQDIKSALFEIKDLIIQSRK